MTQAPEQIEKVHITRTPGVCGGKPCITGTRIRVLDVYVWQELQGKSADEIIQDFPQLTMSDVFAALTYLWDHRDEIVQSLADEQKTSENLKAVFPSKLAEKLRAAVLLRYPGHTISAADATMLFKAATRSRETMRRGLGL